MKSIFVSAGHSDTDPGARGCDLKSHLAEPFEIGLEGTGHPASAVPRAVCRRFFAHVLPVPEAGCWLWTASRMSAGYGQMNVGGRPQLAHRLSWQIHRGAIPEGMYVCHKCDTPACVNPEHLFVGSSMDNARDKCAKGRQRWGAAKGEESAPAKISNVVAAQIFRAKGLHQAIADRYGVNRMTVSHIKLGKQWNSVTGLPAYSRSARA